jgi:hypothetical protein
MLPKPSAKIKKDCRSSKHAGLVVPVFEEPVKAKHIMFKCTDWETGYSTFLQLEVLGDQRTGEAA